MATNQINGGQSRPNTLEMENENIPDFPVDLESESEELIELDEETQDPKKPKRTRRLTSSVSNNFDRLPLSKDKKQRCKCKYCGARYLCASTHGTGNLKRHFARCPRRNTHEVGRLLMSQTSGTMTLSYSKFEPQQFRELLGAAIVLHDLPFTFVEYSGVRAVLSYLNPSVTFISRNTAKADIQKMYKREKERIVYMLNAAPGRINFTSDLWTSLATNGYMSLTAHFIDKYWVLQKRVLNFSLMPPPHSGVALSEKIYNLLSEWGIDKKVFSFTLDNASSNDIAVDLLKMQLNIKNVLMSKGEFLHIRCCTHVQNLIVQEGLKEIDESVIKIRETVKYIRGSQVRKQKILESVKQMSLETTKGLRQDVPTRWNSKFLMLESAIFYRSAFCHLQLTDSNYKHCPNGDEWNKVEKLCTFLAVFYDCTRIFSGTKYPTANLFFPSIWMVYWHLIKQMDNEDEYIKGMARRMFKKFDKYWSEFVPILAIAVILDPRYKLQFVDFSYRMIYKSPDSPEFLKLKEKLYSLFREYEVKYGSYSSSSSSDIPIQSQEGGGTSLSHSKETCDMLKELDQFDYEEMVAGSKKSQLDLYLDEQRMSRDVELDILTFWKGNETRYPVLASMARDILSIPVSTVPSESIFNICGRILDQYRSTLNPKTAEALVCVRDWLYGQQGEAIIKLDELTENIMNLDMNKDSTSTIE